MDLRLFLRAAWADNPARCAKAKVPEDQCVHRTKPELALAMIAAARARGSTPRWVGADEVYGNSHAFTDGLDKLGEIFVVDVAGKNGGGPATRVGRRPRPLPGNPVGPATAPSRRRKPKKRCAWIGSPRSASKPKRAQ